MFDKNEAVEKKLLSELLEETKLDADVLEKIGCEQGVLCITFVRCSTVWRLRI